MRLRPELMPPKLDKKKVAKLAQLVEHIDGAQADECQAQVAEFNEQAGTTLAFDDFQGISASQDAETWVRTRLGEPHQRRLPDITRAELIELAHRVMEAEGSEPELAFWLGMLALNLPDPQISDLIYYPGEYFGDGDDSREMTAEEVVDTALARAGKP